jgi:peroxiredoxin
MVLLKSEGIQLGNQAPAFDLPSVDGKRYKLEDFKGKKALVVIFICNHCPYVKAVEDRYIRLNGDYQNKGVQMVGICSNDPTDYPEDAPQNLLKRWREKEYGFPYLIDETQEVAKAYHAVCTPDIYVYDAEQKLAYHGRIDDHWEDESKVTRQEIREALDALIAGEKPSADQTPSMGCSIKWKK